MTEPHVIINDLEVHNLRTNKEQIIAAAAAEGNDVFFAGCKLALDQMITFGVKQVPEKTDEDGPGLSWDNFSVLAEHLRARKLTGHAARDAIAQAVTEATKAEWNGWYRRILIKDLRCGASEKTINKVVEKKYAKYSIPVFSCQLAHDSTNHESKVTGSKLIEVKLDGVRVITVVYPDGRVDQYSRNGKELVNFPHIKEQLKIAAKDMSCAWVLDGEIMSSSFQDLMKQVHRKSDVSAGDAVLHLFDWLPLENFEQGGWDKTQKERSTVLKTWYEYYAENMPNIRVLDHEEVDLDTDKGKQRYKEINAAAIAGGYEGIMLKNLDAPYECKRTVNWLKLKPFIEVSLAVVDVEEGTGRNVGKLGALVCEGVDDGKKIRVNVGSGFSDANRDDFWTERSVLPGQIVEVRADAITQNQDGSYSLRFPRFLRFRGFEVGEKI